MYDMKSFAENRVKERPFLEETAALHEALYETLLAVKTAPNPRPDFEKARERFAEGAPLLKIPGVGFDDKKVPAEIFTELTRFETTAKIPKAFEEGRARLSSAVAAAGNAESVIENLIAGNNEEIRKFAEKNGADPGLASFLGWAAIERWLSPVVKDIGKWAEKNSWDSGCCPTCGGESVAAVLRKTAKGRRRYLCCGSCHTEWAYRRIGCPYCGNTDQSLLRILEVPGEPGLRADACDACGSYVKTREDVRGDAAAEDWAFLHVDVLCAEAGYRKRGGLIGVP